MSFDDWTKYFHKLYVCQLFPPTWRVPMTTVPESEPLTLQGKWRHATNTCGGSPKIGNANWWRNPQFILSLASGERTQVLLSTSL